MGEWDKTLRVNPSPNALPVADLLGALSLAADLAVGLPAEHGMRACYSSRLLDLPELLGAAERGCLAMSEAQDPQLRAGRGECAENRAQPKALVVGVRTDRQQAGEAWRRQPCKRRCHCRHFDATVHAVS